MVHEPRHLVIVREDPYGIPVGYCSWAEWRSGRSTPAATSTDAIAVQCPMCWGQRKIWETGPLGILPVVCAACAGTGRSD